MFLRRNKNFIFGCLIGLVLAAFFISFLSAMVLMEAEPVLAQEGYGLENIDALGKADLIDIVNRVIRIILGLLGIIAVSFIIYGGIIWMTAGGSREKIAKAKAIISNALIGLIVIFLSYAIVIFVIGKLEIVTNGGGGGGGGGDDPYWPSAKFQIKGIETTHALPGDYANNVYLCSNVQTRFNNWVEKETIDGAESSGTLKIIKKADFSKIDGSWHTLGSTVIFKHPLIFEANTEYQVIFPKTISNTNTPPKFLTACVAVGGCQEIETAFIWNFTTGEESDIEAPYITSTYPVSDFEKPNYPDQNVSKAPVIDVNFSEAVDATTVMQATLPPHPIPENIKIERLDGQGGLVVETLSSNILEMESKEKGFRLNLIAPNLLESFTWYRITVQNIADLCNNPMEEAKIWEFQANDKVPCVSSWYPKGDKVCPDTAISITFNTTMYNNQVGINITGGVDDLSAFLPAAKDLVPPYSITNADGTFSIKDPSDPVDNKFRVFEFVPKDCLSINTDYTVKVTTDMKTGESSTLSKEWNFYVTTAEDCVCSPYISSLSPAQGPKGQCITVLGHCFKGTVEEPALPSKIEFDGFSAVIGDSGDNYITTTLPDNFDKGDKPKCQVTITYDELSLGSLKSNLREFYVDSDEEAKGPCIWSLIPDKGSQGTAVKIKGIRFGSGGELSDKVKFHFEVEAEITSWNDENINTSVPVGASDGNVVVINSEGVSNGVPFDVIGKVGDPCDSNIYNFVCDPDDLMCAESLVCNAFSCKCALAGVGVCGDGNIDHPNKEGIDEQCDDNNTFSGDGCSSTCQIEGVGVACDAIPATPFCDVDNSICTGIDPNLFCDAAADCTCQYQAPQGVEITETAPSNGEENVCRNALISATFNQLMDKKSLQDNFTLYGPVSDVLTNGGFENDSDGDGIGDGWVPYHDDPIRELVDDAVVGDKSQRIVSGTVWGGGTYGGIVNFIPELTVGQTYMVSFYAKKGAMGPENDSIVRISNQSGLGDPSCLDFLVNLTPEWKKYSHTCVLDVAKPIVYIFSSAPSEEFFIDDFQISGQGEVEGTISSYSQEIESTWTTAYDISEPSIVSSIFDSANKVIYAGTVNNGIIYRCDTATGCDEDSDWTVSYDSPESYIWSLAFDSANKVIYAGSGDEAIIYRCDTATGCDEDSDWTVSYDSPEHRIYSLTFDSANKVIYAGSANNGIIYRCDTATGCDEDSDWTVSYDSPEFYIRSLIFDFTNKIIYAGTVNNGIIYRCDTATGCDEDSDWTVSYDSPEAHILSFTFDSANKVIYAGTYGDGIIYRCNTATGCDEDSDWTVSFDSPESYIWSLIFDSANKVIYAGSGNNAIIYRCDTATGCDEDSDWTVSYDSPEFYIWSLVFDSANKVIYAGSYWHGIIYRFASEDEKVSVLTFSPDDVLESNYPYQALVKGGASGVKSKKGAIMNSDYSWEFTTGEIICKLDKVNINVEPPGEIKENDLFRCAGKNDCPDDQGIMAGNQHRYIAQAVDKENNPLAAVYFWAEKDPNELISISSESINNPLITAERENGRAALYVQAQSEGVGGEPNVKVGQINTEIFLCENPWPSIIDFPYIDNETNFSIDYCRDYNSLLPDFDNKIVIPGKGDLIKEFLFKETGGTDAIGIRVMKNPKKLDPLMWYHEKVPNPSNPSFLTIDGYEAIKEGRQFMLNAANVAGGKVYTNIYLISYNEGASQETIDIFNRMLNNWHFTINVDPIEKEKLNRDLARWGDKNEIAVLLENYRNSYSYYPKLESGSYIKEVSASKWPSWQAVLGTKLGRVLPIDPINQFGVCLGYDLETCWDEEEKKFDGSIPDDPPAGSYVYFYNSYNNGKNYQLEVQLEYGTGCIGLECEFAGECYSLASCHPVQPMTVCKIGSTGGEWKNSCGDKIVNCGEQCDTFSRDYCDAVLGEYHWHNEPKFQTCLATEEVNQCHWDPTETYTSGDCGGWCGDGAVNGPEDCDLAGDNGKTCEAPYGVDCSFCSFNCQTIKVSGGWCGDNVVNGPEGVKNATREKIMARRATQPITVNALIAITAANQSF